jgi:hypothetical protein
MHKEATMQRIDNFPKMKEVALLIAYDNGTINRDQNQWQFLKKVDKIIQADGVCYADLQLIEDWLVTLSNGELCVLASGESTEMEALQASFQRPELLEIFNDIFEV